MIRICIVEDQALVRDGLRALLKLDPEFEVVGEACNGEEALEVIAATRPDVLILDVRLPRLNGIEVLRRLEAAERFVPALLLTTFNDREVFLDAIRYGARGYLLKDVTLEQLVRSIRMVASGGTVFQPSLTEALARGVERSRKEEVSPERLIESLTTRELEVLRLMSGGYTNREISEALGLAEGTAKNHVSSVLAKLEVPDRTRAVLKAIEMGVLQ